MTSSINPNNIDGAYPVAGQDNNSQGFRDNFTNTKTNFQYASDEITDLQNKVVLKQALTGTTLNNDMLGAVLSNAQLQDMSQTRVALGSVTGATTINYAAGSYQTLTTSGNISLSFTNWPVAGALGTVAVQISVGATTGTVHTVTFPSNAGPTPLINATGIQGFNTSTNTITFATTGVYTFVFSTSDAGTTITVNEANKSIQPFNNSNEDLADTGAASLALTTSYFTTGAAETATLAAGVSGQIKVFSAVDVTAGDMVVTVTNAGWKSSGTGTITFNDRGQSCILQYTNSKWYVIGSGPGAGNTFAQLA